MSKQVVVELDVLTLHPGQPPDRTLDTTDLQASILSVGLQKPLHVCNDGATIIDGSRRWTAMRRLVLDGHTKFNKVPVIVEEFGVESEAAYKYLYNANVQTTMGKTQLLHTAKAYAVSAKIQHKNPVYKAAVALGMGKSLASLLDKLSRYDAQLDGKLVDALRSHERTGKGLSWSAWKEGSGNDIAERDDGIEE